MDQQYKGTDIKEVATFVQALTERAVKAEHANELPHIFSANGEDYIWRGNMYQKMPEANPKPVRSIGSRPIRTSSLPPRIRPRWLSLPLPIKFV